MTEKILFAVGAIELILLAAVLIWSVFVIKKSAKIRRQSLKDPLTGLYNRSGFNQVREDYTASVPSRLGIVFFDINRLKRTNDSFGHTDGDRLIKTTADCIKSCFGESTFRIGGDEFVAVLSDITREDFEQRLAAVKAKMQAENISVSAGASYRCGGCDFVQQFNEADRKMYADKASRLDTGGTL